LIISQMKKNCLILQSWNSICSKDFCGNGSCKCIISDASVFMIWLIWLISLLFIHWIFCFSYKLASFETANWVGIVPASKFEETSLFYHQIIIRLSFWKKKRKKNHYYKVTSFEAANSTGSIPVSW